jgi:hypothetical protein
VSKGKREASADWLMLCSAPILLASLFMTWSHQFSASFLIRYADSPALRGVPRDPTGWQVYSVADVFLAALAAALLTAALRAGRGGRLAVLLGLVLALVFTVHALGTPPTSGAALFDPTLNPPGYTPNHPTSGIGEVFALVGLGLGAGGTLLSFTAA